MDKTNFEKSQLRKLYLQATLGFVGTQLTPDEIR